MDTYILAYDLGTSSAKASLVDSNFGVVGSHSVDYPTHHPAPDRAEQNPEDWWQAAVQSTQQLLLQVPDAAANIAGIGLTGHMMGTLPIDDDGQPLYPSMIHADTRAVTERDDLEKLVGGQALYQLTGNVLIPNASLCKSLWIKRNLPDVYHKTARFLQSKDYLAYRLTGNMDSTDYSDASHGMLIDTVKKQYLTDVMSELGLCPDKFPTLHKSDDVVGTLSKQAAEQLGLPSGIPVTAGGGDGASAHVGAGLAQDGDSYLSLGTTAWVGLNTAQPLIDPQQRIFNMNSMDGKHYCVFGTVQSAGRSNTWAMELFGIERIEDMMQQAQSAPAGSEGLLFLPYLEGERSPIFDPAARGVFFGINPRHRQQHFLRSVVEGVSYALLSVLKALQEFYTLDELRIIGGGARSDFWKQMLADMGQVPMQDISVDAAMATSMGAAVAAAVGVGLCNSYADYANRVQVIGSTPPKDTYLDVYRQGFARYQMLYPALQPVYHADGHTNKGG